MNPWDARFAPYSQALAAELGLVCAWHPGEWTQVADGYRPIWGRYTEAQFRAMAPRWPDPTV